VRSFYKVETNAGVDVLPAFFVTNGICNEHSWRCAVMKSNDYLTVVLMDVLISGLNNYVGRRCTSLMADEDFRVFAIARNMQLFRKRMSDPVRAQVFEVESLKGGQGEDVVVR